MFDGVEGALGFFKLHEVGNGENFPKSRVIQERRAFLLELFSCSSCLLLWVVRPLMGEMFESRRRGLVFPLKSVDGGWDHCSPKKFYVCI